MHTAICMGSGRQTSENIKKFVFQGWSCEIIHGSFVITACAYLAAHFYYSVFSEVARALLAPPLKKQVLKSPGRCAAMVGRSVVQMHMKSFFLLQ